MSTLFILMRKFFIVSSFFVITPITIFVNIFYLLKILNSQNNSLITITRPHTVAFAALPSSENSMLEDKITQNDARVEIVRQFFEQYKSPLEPFASTVIKVADTYDLDFRLIPAIAMQESNLCKRSPENSFNCWGFGIYGQKVTRFSDYEEGIEAVTKTLALKYKADGLDTPQEIMRRYTPQSNGSWAESVEYFMDQLQ
ncbi:MAG: hypothetical protein A3D74_04735 [Candidatus Levybacteria bacterium RIFCSPHIGHO2_02_FULL_37_13]|nr:MAG: hypothetical protein A3D74_04735 [Candidatus Levybacteria bacterium RIFCSPHIGHO2_02_FULL_37_13]OGH39428.1 MAG: hypothetical protein A3B41_02450 [Candidatus Levybacteria bacterium RIFCSPLOWO2_01_FULL_37_26]